MDGNLHQVIDDEEDLAQPEIGDALILGDECAEFGDILAKPATFLVGELWGARDRRNTQDTKWKAVEQPWGVWIAGGEANGDVWGLSRHPVSKHKEGACIVLGSSVGGARKANAMDEMFAMGLDIDSGATMDEVIDRIEELGLCAVIYTTFSHNKTGIEIKRDEIMKKLQISEDPTLAQIKDFLLNGLSKSKYKADFVNQIKIADPRKQTPEGVKIVLNTPPLEKFRVIFPLAEAVKLIDLAPTQAESLTVWEDKITGLAWKDLGVHFDTACTDPSRLFYTPRHPKGSEDWDSYVIRGKPLRFEDVSTYPKKAYAKSAVVNEFTMASDEGADLNRAPEVVTDSGMHLNRWHRDAKDRFMIADLLEENCPDKIRVAGNEAAGHVHIECPFESYHSSEGGTATMAINALDAQTEFWTVFCRHDSCQGHHKLEFLNEMIAQEWFDEDLLADDSPYMLEPGEEIVDDEGTSALESNVITLHPGQAQELNSVRGGKSQLKFCRDILADLYDPALVDEEGFLIRPDTAGARKIYDRHVIKATLKDESQNRAYEQMVKKIRDDIRKGMRDRFAYVVSGGEARAAVRRASGEEVTWYTEGQLDRLFRNREVSYLGVGGDGKEKIKTLKPSQLFMYDRARATFSATTFEPDESKAAMAEDRGAFNLWTGFAVEPKEGEWSLLRDHLMNVICEGDEQLFNWHMTFCASLFARPGVKVPSSIAVRGQQGTGKSTFWDFVREAMGCTGLKVSRGKDIVGGFNAHMDGKLLMVCEEAFWAGDKAAGGTLKDLISSETVTIEAKHENAVTRKNYLSFVFITNNDWVVPTDDGDGRRYLVLEAADTHKGDETYFKAIHKQMRSGGLEAMVWEFTHWKPEGVGLTWDALRFPPETEGLREQAAMGLDGPMAEMFRFLDEGFISGRMKDGEVFYYELSDTEPTQIARTHLYDVLGVKGGRGNVTAEGRKAVQYFCGDSAITDNKTVITFKGAPVDGERDETQTTGRVRYVTVPALNDIQPTMAKFRKQA